MNRQPLFSQRKNKPMVLAAGILLALFSSPGLIVHLDNDSLYPSFSWLVDLSWLLVIVITLLGLAIRLIYRKNSGLDRFARAVVTTSLITYIGLIFLSFAFIEFYYSQWNILAFLFLPVYILYFYTGGVLAGFFLGMHRSDRN